MRTKVTGASSSFFRGETRFLKRVEFSLACLSTLFVTVNYLRFPNFYFTLSDAFTVCCLLAMIVLRQLPTRPLGPMTPVWWSGSFLLMGFLFLSSGLNGDPERGIIVCGQYFFSLVLLPMIIAGRTQDQLVKLAKVYTVSIVTVCLFGAYVIHIDGRVNNAFVSGSGRLQSFIERENECAALIAISLPLVTWVWQKRHISSLSYLFAISLMFYGILLTASNTGLYCAFIFVAIYALASVSLKNFALWSISILSAAFAVATFGGGILPSAFRKRVLSALESGDIESAGTFVGRLQLIKDAIKTVNSVSFLGLGADMESRTNISHAPVHNFYLLIWAEGGVIALAGFLLIISTGLLLGWMAKKYGRDRETALCVTVGSIVFAAAMNAVPHIYARFWYVPLLIPAALAVRAIAHGSSERLPQLRQFPLRPTAIKLPAWGTIR